MKDLISKIKSFFQKMTAKNSSYQKKSIRPLRDWTVIFVGTQIIIILSAVYAYYFYVQVDSGNYFATDQQNTDNEIKINSELLRKTVDDINTRSVEFDKTKLGNAIPTDPSK